MKENVKYFVKNCINCLVIQTSYQKQANLLQPLPILPRPWHRVVGEAQKPTKNKSKPTNTEWNMMWAKKVLLNVNNFTLSEGLTMNFVPKGGSPFPIVERVLKDMYKLELPT